MRSPLLPSYQVRVLGKGRVFQKEVNTSQTGFSLFVSSWFHGSYVVDLPDRLVGMIMNASTEASGKHLTTGGW